MNKMVFLHFFREDGKGIRLSFDHKPKLGEESERIQANGGFVAMGRVNGRLFILIIIFLNSNPCSFAIIWRPCHKKFSNI
jgi:hypothetical protein